MIKEGNVRASNLLKRLVLFNTLNVVLKKEKALRKSLIGRLQLHLKRVVVKLDRENVLCSRCL